MVKKWYSSGEDLKGQNLETIDKSRLFKETKSNMKLGIVIHQPFFINLCTLIKVRKTA